MNKRSRIFKSKLFIFLIQVLILSSFIYCFNYSYAINFDAGILIERKAIIQILANYIAFEGLYQLLHVYSIWMMACLIPLFIYDSYRKILTINLSTFFLLNFFFYVFLSRYSPIFFSMNGQLLLTRTFLLGFFITMFSLGIPYIINKIQKTKDEPQFDDITHSDYKMSYKCSNCDSEFGSIPKYCYNCLKEININEI